MAIAEIQIGSIVPCPGQVINPGIDALEIDWPFSRDRTLAKSGFNVYG
jgi:hypothetical protein